jgi:uncharacterized protein YcaQ
MSGIKESLSKQEARKLVLLSQKLPPVNQNMGALQNTLSAIQHLGYIQIDTISVVQRAHHHTLWSRNPRYQVDHIDRLVADKKVFEYWSHAAAYLPMRDFRYSLVRKHAIASGKQNHWYERDEKLMKSVMERIRIEGPLMAKDFENTDKKRMDWSSKPAKRALENLFMQGDLMISSRQNFHKVYDLTERVIDDSVDTSMPSEEEYIRHLIIRFLQAHGIGQAAEMAYLLKNTKNKVEKYLQEMQENKELISLSVGDQNYYALADSLELLNRPLSRSKCKILSPFDNLVIQRKRLKNLFDFDYQIECYVPEAKRQYGYFSLPILWNGEMLARVDCKAERKKSILHINHLALEPKLRNSEKFTQSFNKELHAFMKFNECEHLQVHKVSPSNFKIQL